MVGRQRNIPYVTENLSCAQLMLYVVLYDFLKN